MQLYSENAIFGAAGGHLVSETHIRIQILNPRFMERPAPLYEIRHGELLVQVLYGDCKGYTPTEAYVLTRGDQMLLFEGDAFALSALTPTDEPVVQFNWMPGMYACRRCWEVGNRVFMQE